MISSAAKSAAVALVVWVLLLQWSQDAAIIGSAIAWSVVMVILAIRRLRRSVEQTAQVVYLERER